MTKQRSLIYQIIHHSQKHLTAEEIYVCAKKQIPSIAFGTIYRNLKLMAENNEIRKVEILNAPDRYDKTITLHDHLICDSCGTLSDITIPDFPKKLGETVGVSVITYELNIHYICDKCRKTGI